jgi:hypothetical protein
MLTIARPPTRVPRGEKKPKKVFTLHSNANSVFAWRTSNENMKIATVVFRRRQDALLMAHMIERHVRQKKEWPSPTMFDFQLDGGPPVGEDLSLIDINTWEMEALKVFCVEAYLDMVTISQLVQTSDGFRISGELVSLEVPYGLYTERLTHLYNLI